MLFVKIGIISTLSETCHRFVTNSSFYCLSKMNFNKISLVKSKNWHLITCLSQWESTEIYLTNCWQSGNIICVHHPTDWAGHYSPPQPPHRPPTMTLSTVITYSWGCWHVAITTVSKSMPTTGLSSYLLFDLINCR